MRAGWMVVAFMAVLSGGLSAAEVGPELDSKAAANFKVRWSSVRYNKSVTVENPEVSQTPDQKSETLDLTWQAEALDPNKVLATGSHGVITQLTDSKGRDIAVSSAQTYPHDNYEGLRYEQRFHQPTPMPRWRAFIEQVILRRFPQSPSPPQMVTELQPCRITAQLDMGLLDQAGGELRMVKGYFYALTPGSIEQVEVPFEPNNAWVRITSDLEIQVEEAVCGNTFYRYRINARPPGGGFSGFLTVGQSVPKRFVTAQQFIGDDGKPVNRFGGPTWLPMHVAGSGSGSGGNLGRIKAIRFVIAVDAKECKIPFELEHVPLPKP